MNLWWCPRNCARWIQMENVVMRSDHDGIFDAHCFQENALPRLSLSSRNKSLLRKRESRVINSELILLKSTNLYSHGALWKTFCASAGTKKEFYDLTKAFFFIQWKFSDLAGLLFTVLQWWAMLRWQGKHKSKWGWQRYFFKNMLHEHFTCHRSSNKSTS